MQLLSVALVALAVGVYGGGQFRDLSAINKNTVTITSTAVDTTTGFSISYLAADSSYAADGTGNYFAINYNVTYTGTLPASNNVFNYWEAYLTVTGPGVFPNYNRGATCTPVGPAGVLVSGPITRLSASQVSIAGSTQFQLSAVGTYTGTLTLYVFGQQVAQSATFTFTASAAVTAPALLSPTISSFYLPAQQANSTPSITAQLTPTTFDATSSYLTSVAFTAPGNQGVYWITASYADVIGTGLLTDWEAFQMWVGSFCGDAFDGVSGVYIPVSVNTFPQDVPITIRAATIVKYSGTQVSNSFALTTGNLQYTATVGSTDVTPPTCTAATFGTTTVPTGDGSTTTTVTVTTTCTDTGGSAGGSALAYRGTIVRVSTSSGALHWDYLVNDGSTFVVTNFQNGQAQVIGVVALDTTGNAVVYGSCGDLSGQLASLCGGSSASSTLLASLAVVMVCIMAVLAL